MWINDFNWNNQIDAGDIESMKQSLQKQNPNQYLKVLKNEVKQKLSDTTLSQWEKQILQRHLWVSTKAVQRNNVQKFQTDGSHISCNRAQHYWNCSCCIDSLHPTHNHVQPVILSREAIISC